MARTLYRIYLYFVLIVLLYFAAIAIGIFLGSLFQQASGYSGGYGGPIDLRQPAALAFIAFFVTAIFGGLHYWLIRRDIAHDTGASRGAVRAFFLNFQLATAAIVFTAAAAIGLSQLGETQYGGASAFGPAVSFGVLFALLEIERRRGQPDRGGAVVLQRLNLYGIQLILLFIMAGYLVYALYQTIGWLIIKSGNAPNPCVNQYGYEYCYFDVRQSLLGPWLAALLTIATWAGYSLLARGDTTSRLRAVFRFLGLAFGVSYTVVGIQQGVASLLRTLFGVPSIYEGDGVDLRFLSAIGQFAFVSTLLFGLLVAVVYWLWLQSDARHGGEMSRETTYQGTMAVAAVFSAFPFFAGLALTLGGLVERVVPNGTPPSASGWATNLATIIAGALYIPLALWLGARARATGVSTPRRAFVYALLAYGTLGTIFSLIFVLYAFVTNALGEPLQHWEQLARQGIANMIIGAIIIGLYVFIARREGWFTRHAASADAAEGVPTPPAGETVESILDDLLARRLSRDEAAARIRSLAARGG